MVTIDNPFTGETLEVSREAVALAMARHEAAVNWERPLPRRPQKLRRVSLGQGRAPEFTPSPRKALRTPPEDYVFGLASRGRR